ncbi:Afadin/alpha-actinin-binding [Trema orientale]|uniref:Afadin/alpha-actinin-binding n=1 Tax=Trema orientale TaxID=63057 RepID=A0A2P5E1Z8_TREOI|nr:Afadin/alpha-actinin-binding [Trema orientale]
MNVDAAINAQSCSVGVGALILNANGEVMTTLAKKVTGTLSAKIVKVKAPTISLLWTRDVGLNLQFLESDALIVVQALKNGSICHSEFDDLLLDNSPHHQNETVKAKSRKPIQTPAILLATEVNFAIPDRSRSSRRRVRTGQASETDFDLRPSPQSAFGMGEYTFADVGNLEHCVKYLNQTLVTFGFPASLDLFANDPVSVARTCNCMYALIQQRQRDVEFRESANEQRQRLLSDITRLEAKVERLEGQLQAKDREIATITRTEAKATAAFKAQIEKLQQERDEFQRMVIGNQQVRTQQIHEMKKKEKEYIKLQERLNQVLMEKKKESRSGMEIMNLLQVWGSVPPGDLTGNMLEYSCLSKIKEGRQRGTWNGKKADNDFYKKIVDAYEAKNQELMQENADLKALLRSMQATQRVLNLSFWVQVDMRDFINAPNGSSKQSVAVNEGLDTEPARSPFGGRTDVFDLPFHMARDKIEESLRTKMASIMERMVQSQDAQKRAEVTSEATERELELEAQLVEARSIIQEQASIMSKHLAKSERPRSLNDHFNSTGEGIVSSPAKVWIDVSY